MEEKNEVNKEENIRPEREFNLGDKAYFFLNNSFDVNLGEVVGFFLNFEKDGEKMKQRYWYQLEYERDMIDGSKRKYFATIPSTEIKISKDEIDKIFNPLRKQRIIDAILKEDHNLEGVNVDIKTANEAVIEIKKEKDSLIKKYEDSYGKYKE